MQHDERGFDIAFIEYDQRGDFWDRQQLAIARHQLRQRLKGKRPLLVQYVHGWHHNAQEDPNRDVIGFRNLLAFLAESKYIRDAGYQVFGVYHGWRGELIRDTNNPLTKPLVIGKQLTFYRVKRIGTDVGTMPMITESLFWMVHEARAQSRNARTVLIGHSFGALVLENAIAQAVAGSAALTPEGANVPAPADLVLLLNSAADSMRAKGLTEMLDRMGRSVNVNPERPLVISVTSSGDAATGVAFPIGTGLSNLFKGFRSYDKIGKGKQPKEFPRTSQRKFVTTTPGHNEFLLSHDVTAPAEIQPSNGKLADPKVATRTGRNGATVFEENLRDPQPPQGEPHNRAWPFRSVAKGGGVCWSKIQVRPDPWMRTSYWLVKAPKEIIRNHGDIFNEQALCLYAALFRIENPHGTKAPSGPRMMSMAPPSIDSPAPIRQ